MLVPGFQDAHVHPVGGGVDMLQCDQHDLDRRTRTSSRSRRTRAHIPTNPGSWVGVGRRTSFRAAVPPRRTSTRSCRTGRCSCPIATATARGSNSKALEIAGITRRHARPRRRPDRAQCRWLATGHPARGRADARRRATSRRCRPTRSTRGCSRARRISTRSASRAGRTRSWTTRSRNGNSQAYLAAAAGARSRAASWAPCGGSARAAWSRSTIWWRCVPAGRRAGSPRPASRSCRTASCENFTGATIDPYLDEHGARDRQQRALDGRSGVVEGGRDASGRARFPGALPRPRRSRGSRGAGCDRGRRRHQRLQRSPPPSGAPADRAPRRPGSVPSARRARQRAAAVGGPRGADGRADDPVPRRAAMDLAVPVRLASCARARRS